MQKHNFRDSAFEPSLLQEAIHKLGGLDYIVSNAGWTKFADFKDLSKCFGRVYRPRS